MIKLDFMEKMLDGIEVEWKTLGEACEVYTGGEAPTNSIKGLKPSDTYKYPIYGNGADVYGYTDSYRIEKDAVTISSIGAKTGTIYFRKAFFTPIIRLKVLIPKNDKLLPRYIYHYLSSGTISSKKSSVPNMNAADVKKISIPIPSLEIQTEIVRILDAFTELTAELTAELKAELTARKKQYTNYRDQLLTFEEGEVEWKTLGEVCNNIFSGKNKKRDDEGMYPVYGSTGVIGRTSNIVYEKEHILVARVGANAGYVYISKGQYDVSDNTLIVQNKEDIILKFLYYILVNMNLNQFAKGAGQPLITGGQLKSIQIPAPPLIEQERIVSILDKFDALISSITEGLPGEKELRQKQYEYYRNMLLSFPKEV